MYPLEDPQQLALVDEALEVLAAVTTTKSTARRRSTVASLLRDLEGSLECDDPRAPLRWAAIEREREGPRDLSNMVFAASHVLSRRAARTPGFATALSHFRRVQSQLDAALHEPAMLERIRKSLGATA